MIKMKKLVAATIAIIAFASYTHAQNPLPIEILYDAAGNRIIRKVLQIPLSSKGNVFSDSTYYIDNTQSIQMKVYPNPTQGKILIEMSEVEESSTNIIHIFDSQGKRVYASEGQGNQMEIDLSTYPAGYYMVELYVNDEHTTWKIIKK